MGRLIEVGRTIDVPESLTVAVSDILSFAASGGRVREGTAVELLGILTTGVVGTDGRVLSPSGPPNAVLFRARSAGRAGIDVVTGGPSRSDTRRVSIVVEPQ